MTKSKIAFCDIFAYGCFLILTLFIIFSAVHVSQDKKDISQSVLRLHVLANSNEKDDIKIKFLVRDEILCISEKLSLSDINNAKKDFIDSIPSIKKQIEKVLLQNGADYNFDIQVSDELYPARRYGGLVFPQGKYLSVRVNLGKAAGDNWWCVLFPPICVSAASHNQDYQKQLLKDAHFSQSQIDLLYNGTSQSFYPNETTGKLNVKIKLFEVIKKLTS